MKYSKEEKSKQAAELMIKAGMDKEIKWKSITECAVPSQTDADRLYDVDIVNTMCNCPASTQKG